jgi:hypothetical protein
MYGYIHSLRNFKGVLNKPRSNPRVTCLAQAQDKYQSENFTGLKLFTFRVFIVPLGIVFSRAVARTVRKRQHNLDQLFPCLKKKTQLDAT